MIIKIYTCVLNHIINEDETTLLNFRYKKQKNFHLGPWEMGVESPTLFQTPRGTCANTGGTREDRDDADHAPYHTCATLRS